VTYLARILCSFDYCGYDISSPFGIFSFLAVGSMTSEPYGGVISVRHLA
jgi:hypothetical protein